MDDQHILLICTVGGSPEPIVASLKHWRPARIHFIPTSDTREVVDQKVIPLAEAEGLTINPGCYDILELADGQDLAACLDKLRPLTPLVQQWLSRGDAFDVAVDFTGGTKCMSAALALQGHRWRCTFSYVGGMERTKDGVGIVITGKEQVLHAQNPWDALGFQAVEEFGVLFDQHAFGAAVALADRAMRNSRDPVRKREFNALKAFAEAYDCWDRFDHKRALDKFQELAKSENDLRALLGGAKAEELLSKANSHGEYLRKLIEGPSPSVQHVTDLMANAQRRRVEGRIDDAVARLYRSIESLAQVALSERYQIKNTKQVPLNSVPEPLREQWSSRADDGSVFLGLQDAYALLAALGDKLGLNFKQLQLDDRQRSPLTARNQSILAHGFERASEKVFEQLWKAAAELSSADEASLPSFPKLSDS